VHRSLVEQGEDGERDRAASSSMATAVTSSASSVVLGAVVVVVIVHVASWSSSSAASSGATARAPGAGGRSGVSVIDVDGEFVVHGTPVCRQVVTLTVTTYR
jgi:hypothetical protein